MPAKVQNKVCLIVHDGWGLSDTPADKGNAVAAGSTTHMDAIAAKHSFRKLAAHGLAVGLSDGLMGNSEVGHLNIGAGRIVWQDIVKIDQSIKKREFHKNEVIRESLQHAKDTNGRVHFIGLISDGGVHSHIKHLYALIETAREVGVPHVFIHFLGDGRDTDPKSANKYMRQLVDFIAKDAKQFKDTTVEVATIVGRYYAMDRDKRWERVKLAVDGLVLGEGKDIEVIEVAKDGNGDELVKIIEARYEKNEKDEFLKPIVVKGDGRIKDKDTLFFFNYRSDRMREIVSVFGLEPKPMEVQVPKDLHITTMSRYNIEFPFNIAFPPQGMTNVLAEWLSKQGVKQAHVAETEKYAHVTFFFNGGVEKQFEAEERHMIASPKVATYDLQPAMSAQGVADKVAALLAEGTHEFVMCNFAPPDMVGHTGIFDAAVEAIGATDAAVKTIYDACEKAGYVLVVTADHGNAEQMQNSEGTPHTAHTTNPVPLIVTGDKKRWGLKEDTKGLGVSDDVDAEVGALCDVAPTILDIMGLDVPKEMSGRSLLERKK
ncbi:phosphoglycerate mutase [Auricularia subglabra TFB-10046 SS5]|uniref:phosphoglycerate mutase (2,3-diphosphoglycerate-independent) n=1 Tax=Auricularia subglabra (strain TFB-10046 / SS5) TaxID=717982 RepID=J0D298_AURST|nr:phosphoglycerate mutase [Auricularia subglabra TFB-10046 SS5]